MRQLRWHEIRRRKARAGKNSFPPTPFLFARPSVRFRSCRAKRGNQSGFCSKKVRAAFSNCGVNITPAQAEFEIINPNTLYFSATADQTDVVRLEQGRVGKISFDAYPDDAFNGTLIYVSFIPKEDETGTVYKLKFQLDDKAMSLPLKMKMTGDLDILLQERKNVLAVPSGFIKKDRKGSYVKVSEQGKEVKKYVETDEEIGGNVIIKNGLSPGDVIYD